jgi:hypothetical protein
MGMATGDLDALARGGATPKVSSEKLDGVDCWRIEVTRERGSVIMWLDKQYGLPRQTTLGDRTARYRVEQVNAVPDSLFTLPQGVKVVEAPAGGGPGGGGGRGGGGGAGAGGPGGVGGGPVRRGPQ